MNTLVVLADLAFSARPWRWHHVIQPFVFTYGYG